MRIFVALVLMTLVGSVHAQQSPEPERTGPMPKVDRWLTVKGAPIGRIFEGFRPQIRAYLREIEEANDYSNWRVKPAKAYEQ